MNNSTYIATATNLIVLDMIDEAIGEEESLAKSLDDTKAILEFSTEYPNSMADLILAGTATKYDHAGIVTFRADDAVNWGLIL